MNRGQRLGPLAAETTSQGKILGLAAERSVSNVTLRGEVMSLTW